MRAPLCVRLKRANAHFRSHRNKYPRPEVENGRKCGRLRRILGPCRLINENRRRFGSVFGLGKCQISGRIRRQTFSHILAKLHIQPIRFQLGGGAVLLRKRGFGPRLLHRAHKRALGGFWHCKRVDWLGNRGVYLGRAHNARGGGRIILVLRLTVGIGAMAYSRLDNTWLGLPVGFIDWKITDRLRLRTFSGAALLYDIFGDNSLILNAVAEYRNSYYRLANSSEGRRSVSDSFVQFSVGATYNISKRAYISAAIGGNFNREIALRINSRSSGEYEIDAAPFFSLHAGFSF